MRGKIEARRKELKADSLEYGRRVDAVAKDLTALVESLEEPLQLQKDAVDAEKERIKREAAEAKQRAIEEEARQKLEAERQENERKAAIERAELELQKAQLAEQRAQAEAAQRAERDRLNAERAKLEAEKLETERAAKAERERALALQREEQAALDAARKEAERLAALARDEELAKHRLEQAALAAERARLETEKAELAAAVEAEKVRVAAEAKAKREAEWLAENASDIEKLIVLARRVEDFAAESQQLFLGSFEAKSALSKALNGLGRIPLPSAAPEQCAILRCGLIPWAKPQPSALQRTRRSVPSRKSAPSIGPRCRMWRHATVSLSTIFGSSAMRGPSCGPRLRRSIQTPSLRSRSFGPSSAEVIRSFCRDTSTCSRLMSAWRVPSIGRRGAKTPITANKCGPTPR
jgi:chemotaxis protein histidine kinase CheA